MPLLKNARRDLPAWATGGNRLMNVSVVPDSHPAGGIALQFDLDASEQLIGPVWQFAGRELCFFFLPPQQRYRLTGKKQFAKVIVGRLENPDRGCFAEPYAVRSTLVDSEELVAGPEGALVALLTETAAAPDSIDSMEAAQFSGALSEQLVWRSFEARFGEFMDFFNVNFWTCGKGVDLSTHNHAQDPSAGSPAFAEVHWVIEAATPASGMYRTPEPQHSERARYPMARGDEHGPYFEFDPQTRLPRLRENGAVTYGWHGWQGGADSGPQGYDLVAAFEINPRYAAVI